MKRLFVWGLGAVLFVGALWVGWSFRAGNDARVEVDLVWMSVQEIEVWRLVVMAAGFGALLATGGVGFAWLRARILNRRYRGMIRRLESELHELRSLPLTESDDRDAGGALHSAGRG